MYWQNSKFRNDFAEKIDCVIRSSKMISNFTANEIEKCIFNAFQHDSEVYFQQIYDLTIYIRKHKNYEHLTQVVLNNPSKALKHFNDNARKLVAEPRIPVAEPCIPVAEPRIPVAEPCIPVAEPRIPVVEPRIPVAEPRIPELAEPRTFKTLVPRVLFEDEPHTAIHPVPCVYSEHTSLITSVVKSCISLASKLRTYKRDMTAVEIHRESRNRVLLGEEPSISLAPKSRTLSRIRRNILAIPLGKKSSISYKELIVLLGKSPTRPRVTDGIANFRKEYIEELRLKKCSDYCYKKFMELGKMLEVLPYNDSVCKMCMYQSSIAVPANAVFYSCGHNFLCHQCAMKYWNEGKSCGCAGCLVNSKVVCPICSEEIQDVIKSYCPF